MDLREMTETPAGENRVSASPRHPWEESRARFFRGQLGPHLRGGMRVLDVGAGDGYLAASLLPSVQPGGGVVCFDTHYSDLLLARFSASAPAGLRFTRDRPDSGFEVVLMLDVLEHVPDDRAFLEDIVGNLLAPGGVLLASVPAYQTLFTRHDVVLGHHRRYRLRELRRLVESAGLQVETSAGLFHSLLPVRAAQKLGELVRGVRTRPAPDSVPDHADTQLTAWNGSPWIGRTILAALRLDNRMSAAGARMGITLPGLSVWVLARKP